MSAPDIGIAMTADNYHQKLGFARKLRQQLERAAEQLSLEECEKEISRHNWQVIRMKPSSLEDDEYGVIKNNLTPKGVQGFLANLRLLEELLPEDELEMEGADQENESSSYGQPNPERLKLAFALASEVAAKSAQAVFNAVCEDRIERLDFGRWMFYLNYDTYSKQSTPGVKAINNDQMVFSLKELPERLLEANGIFSSNQDLADIAAACNQELAERIERQEARKAKEATRG